MSEEIAESNATAMFNEPEEFVSTTLYPGMLYANDDIAYDMYNSYAKKLGFGIKRHTTRKLDGKVMKRYYTCSREGHKRKMQSEVSHSSKVEERCGCMARIVIKRVESCDESWVLCEIIDEHNHELLASLSKIRKLRSHNKTHMEKRTRSLVNDLSHCNVGPAFSVRILMNITSDPDIHITAGQCSQILRTERQYNIGSQCASVIQHFIDCQWRDPQFFYAVEIDDDGVCRSLFWADERARTSYMKFCDVLVFDVTYKTNSFMLPFAPFTGVNQHRQSTLFGCALLADETEPTFVWLFSSWLKCMLGKEPGAIITDQDPTICKAIERVFPNTRHRYCIWHITLHEDEHLRPLRTQFGADFQRDYSNWKTHSETVEESDACWVLLNERYNFHDSNISDEKRRSLCKAWRWCQSMYEKRRHWIFPYLKDAFFAGMKSSQRSESMNSFFDGFVQSKTPLVEFVRQYEEAIQIQREKEDREDKVCMTTQHSVYGMHELEAHAARVYTRKIFEIFQEEFKDVFHCRHKLISSEDELLLYEVSCRLDGVITTKKVRCAKDGYNFSCSCAKFESFGILCKHILYIMIQKFDFLSIPEKFLLQRWTLAFRYSTSHMASRAINSSDNRFEISLLEFWKLKSQMNRIVNYVENHPQNFPYVLNVVSDLEHYCLSQEQEKENEKVGSSRLSMHKTDNFTDGTSSPNVNVFEAASSMVHESSRGFGPLNITIFDPKKCITKGRPAAVPRFKSGIEKSKDDAAKRSRTCSICGERGHDVRTCAHETV